MLAVGVVLTALASPAVAAERAVPVEVCDNQLDDDGDGSVDEQQCLLSESSLPVSGSGVVPELWNDNPQCSDMGYDFGFKTDGCTSGTYYFVASDGELTGGAQPDASAFVTIVCEAGEARVVDWSANLAMDAVFIKGGPVGGNLYNYDPEATGDTGLGTPGTASAISHIEFCYDYELGISKTAAGAFDRTYNWMIQKDFDGSYDKNIGDSATTHGYQVSVDQTVTESNFVVSGSIDVDNSTPFNATIVAVDDVLSDGTSASVSCGVSFPYVLAAGSSLSCTYSASPSDASATLNTVTVTTSGAVDGGTATAAVSFTPTIVGSPTVNVSDTNGKSWSASGDASWAYTSDFVCPSDQSLYAGGVYSFTHENTATITETGAFDTATVTVNCYMPLVSKTANGSLDREWEWQITKGDDATYDDFIGDPATTHNYSITVTRTGQYSDSNWQVDGTIAVANPGTLPMTLGGVTDSVDGVAATVSCPNLIVPAGGSLECTYTATADDGLDGDETLNTATATLNGFAFSGTAAVSYVVGNEINAEVNVTDSADGQQQSYGPFADTTTFDYDHDFQCPANPDAYTNGSYSLTRVNTATIDETGDFDTATVTLNCYAPVVTKSASGSYDERHDWDIEKTVDPAAQSGFAGESMSWTWTVTLSETAVDENYSVAGDITVANGHPSEAMTLTELVDSIDGVAASVSCPSLVVPAAGTLVCSYSASADDGLDGDESLNVATATFNGIDFSGQAGFTYQVNVVNSTADVSDDREPDLPTTVNAGEGPWTWTETEQELCSTDGSLYDGDGSYDFSKDNQATVTGSDGQTDSADTSTTVTCYAPIVSKSATGAYDERHEWEVEKTVSPVSQTGFAGDAFDFDWTVTVTESIFDENFAVSGIITVSNPNPDSAMTVALGDVLDDGTVAEIDDSSCAFSGGSLTVAAGSSEACSYTASPADGSATLNTATASLNNVDFTASDGIEWSSSVIRGSAVLTDDQEPLNEPLSGAGPTYTFIYGDTYTCEDAASTSYVGGSYSTSEDNTAIVSSEGEEQDRDTATADFTCRIPALARVVKTTTEGDEDIGQFPFEFGLFEPGADTGNLGNAIETASLNGAGEVNFSTELEAEGTWTVVEFLPAGWFSETDLSCEISIAYPGSADQTYTCDFDNTEASRVDLLKLTNGSYDETKTWNFTLYEGPNGFAGTEVASDSTPTSPADAGLLRFGSPDLDPDATYTVCELGVPAGFATVWVIDSNTNGTIDINDTVVLPYNPNASDNPPEDLGNRCVDFGAGTLINLVPGTTLHFIVDNQAPGGAPRTPGYWKNWNSCTGGNQQYTAAANGGWQEGFWLLEDVLDPAIGGGVVWDDILPDDGFLLTIDTCAVAVDILDKRLVDDPAVVGDGRKRASDPLHNLATHLLAAQLNFGAGACTTQVVLDAALAAESLLDEYDFDGNGYDGRLKSNDPDGKLANQLAAYLDAYNNGEFCGDGVE